MWNRKDLTLTKTHSTMKKKGLRWTFPVITVTTPKLEIRSSYVTVVRFMPVMLNATQLLMEGCREEIGFAISADDCLLL